MTAYIILLRLIHIIGGVFWAGSSFMLAGFVQPAVQGAGPAGGQVMQQLMGKTRFPMIIAASSIATLLSGILLYERRSGGFSFSWIGSTAGLVLTIGAIAGIFASIVGGAIIGKVTAQLTALGAELQSQAGPPNKAKLAEMKLLQEKLTLWSRIGALLLIIAIIGMAMFDYL